MISAVLYQAKGRYTGFLASGHSGYAEAGSDIVCAGVSALSITCVNAMENLLGIQVSPRVEERTGMLAFDLPELVGEQESGAQLLMGALGQGLRDMQETYPGYVKFQIKERRK